MTKQAKKQAVLLLLQGVPHKEIAKLLCISRTSVGNHAREAVALGILDRKTSKPRAVVTYLPPEVIRWAINQLPEGVPLNQFLASIITDAYYEETGQ